MSKYKEFFNAFFKIYLTFIYSQNIFKLGNEFYFGFKGFGGF